MEKIWSLSVEKRALRVLSTLLLCLMATTTLVSAFPVAELGSEQRIRLAVVSMHQSRLPIASLEVSRRTVMLGSVSSLAAATSFLPQTSRAALWAGDQDRRQLELCLVTVQRVLYWAEGQAMALSQSTTTPVKPYLETRLGAKALLTTRVGGGATAKVYTMATLQLSGCLADLEWHGATKKLPLVSGYKQDLTEGLAAIVEFDGLETLIDPSPRSSLTVSQYNDSKAVFVRRALVELVIPAGNKLMNAFGPDVKERSLGFVEQYYSSEKPAPLKPITE